MTSKQYVLRFCGFHKMALIFLTYNTFFERVEEFKYWEQL